MCLILHAYLYFKPFYMHTKWIILIQQFYGTFYKCATSFETSLLYFVLISCVSELNTLNHLWRQDLSFSVKLKFWWGVSFLLLLLRQVKNKVNSCSWPRTGVWQKMNFCIILGNLLTPRMLFKWYGYCEHGGLVVKIPRSCVFCA